MAAVGSADQEDDDLTDDSFSMLIGGVGALATAAGFTFTLHANSTARTVAARSTVGGGGGGGDGRQPTVEPLRPTLQSSINSPAGE